MEARRTELPCYCAASRRVARALTRMYEAELRTVGINPAQFELMCTLRARPGCGQSALAKQLDVDQTTLSRNLKLLIKQGWVRTRSSPLDRRTSAYRLSAAGAAVLQSAMPHWRRATARVQRRLSRPEPVWKALDALLNAAA